jgi:sugar phosphate isomerase/epimerase
MRVRLILKAMTMAVTFAMLQGCSTGGMSTGKSETKDTFKVPEWKLGSQAYTFRRFTFLETLDKLSDLGIHYVEAYPGQPLGEGLDGRFIHRMPPETRTKVKQALKEAGVTLAAYGVVGGRDENEWKTIFEFAKDMGISSITCEPKPEHMAIISTLCDQHDIRAAIHNHPDPSHYWNPDTVLETCKGLSERVGACADTGHWARSGLNPVDCLKKLEGRIVSLHFKDLNGFGNHAAHDVPWGSGVCDTDAMMTELARQGFDGLVSIEYEKDDDQLENNVAMCVEAFNSWDGPTRFVDDINTVLTHIQPGPSAMWTDPAKKAQHSATKGYVNTADGSKGTVTASNNGFPNEGPNNAFDGAPSKWCLNQNTSWVTYTYADGAKQTITAYAIMSANDSPSRDPKHWTLLGSNDGSTWTEVDARSDEKFSGRHQMRLFKVKAAGAYNSYKLDVSANNGDASSQIAELQLLVKETK